MLLTVKQAAEKVHTNTNYIYKLINHGLLPALKLGSLKIREEALEQFLASYEGYDVDAIMAGKEGEEIRI